MRTSTQTYQPVCSDDVHGNICLTSPGHVPGMSGNIHPAMTLYRGCHSRGCMFWLTKHAITFFCQPDVQFGRVESRRNSRIPRPPVWQPESRPAQHKPAATLRSGRSADSESVGNAVNTGDFKGYEERPRADQESGGWESVLVCARLRGHNRHETNGVRQSKPHASTHGVQKPTGHSPILAAVTEYPC